MQEGDQNGARNTAQHGAVSEAPSEIESGAESGAQNGADCKAQREIDREIDRGASIALSSGTGCGVGCTQADAGCGCCSQAICGEIAALLERAGSARLIGLVDPLLPALDPAALERLAGTVANGYAASMVGANAFVSLAPGEDALFVARLLLDRSLPCVGAGEVGSYEAAAAETGATKSSLLAAVDRYWRSRLDEVAEQGEVWARAASAVPLQASGEAMAVLTIERAAPLCLALGRLGAEIFGAEAVAALSPHYRRVVFVLGNTAEDAALLGLLRRYGGDVVLAEACLLSAYNDRSALALAGAELGRAVPETELRQWRAGVARPPVLLLGEVAASASRLFVHSGWLAGEIATRYRRDAIVLPAAADGRQVAAHAAGLWAECCVWAVEMLGFWGEAVRLDLVCPASERAGLAELAARLGVAERIGFGGGAADVALFLAMRGAANWSGALARAVSAGLGCVASVSVSEGVDVSGVEVLPDQPSPPLLAEALLRLLPRESVADRAAAALYRALGVG